MIDFDAILEFIGNVVVVTLSQLLWLLGVLFVYGLLLYLFARLTRTSYVKSVGAKFDVIFTGWVGTPVHELGHAVFCILFRHKIIEMKLYNPNPADGTLGYVSHTYNIKSRYQRIGNLFIGIGPILFGSLVLYALLYFLMPGFLNLFTDITIRSTGLPHDVRQGNFLNIWNVFRSSATSFMGFIFDPNNLHSWRFWAFLYLSFCVSSHMELSPPDIKGAKSGLITLVFTVLILNFVIMGIEVLGFHSFFGEYWQYVKMETYAPQINMFLGLLGSLLTYALIISGLNFILTYIILSIYNLIRDRGFFSPF